MCTLSRLNKRVRLMLFNSLVNQEIGFFEDKKTGRINFVQEVKILFTCKEHKFEAFVFNYNLKLFFICCQGT